jgi:hypothetical protein
MKTQEKKEIIWNIINSVLAGVLVLLGALTTGGIGLESFLTALIAAGVVAVTKFQQYWACEEQEYKNLKLFNFIR